MIDYSGNNNKIQKIMNAATIALITAALAAALIITNITTNAAAVSSASKQAPLCSSGTTFNLSYARCEASPICPTDTTFNAASSECEAQPSMIYPPGFTPNTANYMR